MKWAVLLVTICFAVAVAIGLVLHWNGWSCATSAACVARLGWLPAIRSAADALATPGPLQERRTIVELYTTQLAMLAPLAGAAFFASAASLALATIRRNRPAIVITAAMGIVASFILKAYGTEIGGLFYSGGFELANWLRVAVSLASIYAGLIASVAGAVVVFLGSRTPLSRAVG